MTTFKINNWILIITSVLVVSCFENSDTPASPTTVELLDSLEGFAFSVTVPEDITKEQFAGLAIVKSNGDIMPLGSSNEFKPGSIIRYICYHPQNGTFRYSYNIGSERKGSGQSNNFPKSVPSISGQMNRLYTADEGIIRYSEDSKLQITGEPVDDDFDLIFHVQKPTKQKK